MSLLKLKQTRDLEISMTALTIGSSVLQIGGGDSGLIAALAATAGLSGHACALVETAEAAEAFAKVAAAAGVLVEVAVGSVRVFPYDPDRFDVVVVKDAIGNMRAYDRVLCLQQAFRVLRGGGRCLVIEQTGRAGLGALFSRRAFDSEYLDSGGATVALEAESFRGVRRLAERDGVSFYEGTK